MILSYSFPYSERFRTSLQKIGYGSTLFKSMR
nr:MAG TPA: hypothetical protein [Caudoviricetes sp.]